MRVLQVGKYFPPVRGGIESHLRDLCAGLVKKGVAVTCVVSSTSGKSSVENIDGVKLVRLGKFPFRHPVNPSLPVFLKRSLKANDVVHLHMPNPSSELAVLIAKPERLIVSYHADVVGKFGSGLYVPFQKKVLRMAERIIVSSEKYAKGSGILKPFLGKCVFVPYGVDLKRFGGRKGFLAVPGPVFLFVGRLVEYKGLKYLVRAMRDVEGSLVLAGRGPLLPVLRSQAGRLGVRAYFLPNVSDAELPALYNSCDVFVLPSVSRAEAFGIVQLEAMACGKPVISTFDFVNQHMKTGIVVPPADVSALAGAMRRLCNKQLRSRLGARARRRVRKEFQAGMMVDRILRLYRSN